MLAREIGVSEATLSRWKTRWLGGVSALALQSNDMTGTISKLNPLTRPQDRAADEKFRIVSEARGLNDAALGEVLRREGIHKAQLDEWSGKTRAWGRPTEVILNPDGKTETKRAEGELAKKEQSRGLRKGRQQTVRDNQKSNKQPNIPLTTVLNAYTIKRILFHPSALFFRHHINLRDCTILRRSPDIFLDTYRHCQHCLSN